MSDVHTARIGPYRLIRRLAAGSMGVVYLGEDTDGRRVALKVVRPDLAGEAEFRIRFRQEVHAALSVSGAHTAAVVGVDLGAAEPWLAVEYLDGPTLAELVAAGGPLSTTRVRRLLGQLAAALAAIHAAGIVHRDLKPGNVILAAVGPRVIDFGVARIPTGSDLTDDHQLLGSPGYLAPEYLRGVAAHPPGDLFALGATLLHATTGRPPFGAGPPEAVLDRAAAGEPDTDGVPPALAAVLRALLDPDPTARPSAESLVPPPRTGTGRHRARVRRTGRFPRRLVPHALSRAAIALVAATAGAVTVTPAASALYTTATAAHRTAGARPTPAAAPRPDTRRPSRGQAPTRPALPGAPIGVTVPVPAPAPVAEQTPDSPDAPDLPASPATRPVPPPAPTASPTPAPGHPASPSPSPDPTGSPSPAPSPTGTACPTPSPTDPTRIANQQRRQPAPDCTR